LFLCLFYRLAPCSRIVYRRTWGAQSSACRLAPTLVSLWVTTSIHPI